MSQNTYCFSLFASQNIFLQTTSTSSRLLPLRTTNQPSFQCKRSNPSQLPYTCQAVVCRQSGTVFSRSSISATLARCAFFVIYTSSVDSWLLLPLSSHKPSSKTVPFLELLVSLPTSSLILQPPPWLTIRAPFPSVMRRATSWHTSGGLALLRLIRYIHLKASYLKVEP